jgi:hypothetical protein
MRAGDRLVVVSRPQDLGPFRESSFGVDVSTVREAAAHVEPTSGLTAQGLEPLQLERHRHGRVRGVYIARRRPQATDA